MLQYPRKEDKMNKFVAYTLLSSMALFVVALAFSYDVDFQNALYTIDGFLWIIFGTWAAILLLKK